MENKTPLFLGIAAVAIIGIAAFAFTSGQSGNGAHRNPDYPEDG
ncbi:MAG: hypothetical protein N2691_03830 [Patescibacteria group bacterium]|nr:hypothetical protein [Patescibacteria group bacterium]